MLTSPLTQEISQLHADFCSALADPTRLLLLYALADGDSNVSDLASKLGIPQPTASRHLKILRDHGLVEASRRGMTVWYALTDHRIIESLDLLRAVLRDRLARRAGLVDSMK